MTEHHGAIWRAALLDVDGTLVDSNDAHAQAWVDACHELGFVNVRFERVRPLIGMGADKLLEVLVEQRPGDPLSRLLRDRHAAHFHDRYARNVQPFPRVRELLERMRADGLRLIAATSSRMRELRLMLDAAGVRDLIDDASSYDQRLESQPAPELIESALERADEPRERVCLLGDTPYDAAAAQRAHIAFIGLRCGGWPDHQLVGALAIYDDPADLLDHYDRSPLARPSTPAVEPAPTSPEP